MGNEPQQPWKGMDLIDYLVLGAFWIFFYVLVGQPSRQNLEKIENHLGEIRVLLEKKDGYR